MIFITSYHYDLNRLVFSKVLSMTRMLATVGHRHHVGEASLDALEALRSLLAGGGSETFPLKKKHLRFQYSQHFPKLSTLCHTLSFFINLQSLSHFIDLYCSLLIFIDLYVVSLRLRVNRKPGHQL